LPYFSFPSSPYELAASRNGAIALTDREIFLSRLVLPVAAERLEQAPSPAAREAAERSNEGVLGFLLQGVELEAMPRSTDERLAEALAPVWTKLDTIIDMLGRLSYRDVALPPLHEAELGPGHFAWLSALPQEPGRWLRLELYFDPIFREPVVVFARVASCADNGAEAGCWVRAELCELSQAVGEKFARLALLAQRRQRSQRPIHPAIRGEP